MVGQFSFAMRSTCSKGSFPLLKLFRSGLVGFFYFVSFLHLRSRSPSTHNRTWLVNSELRKMRHQRFLSRRLKISSEFIYGLVLINFDMFLARIDGQSPISCSRFFSLFKITLNKFEKLWRLILVPSKFPIIRNYIVRATNQAIKQRFLQLTRIECFSPIHDVLIWSFIINLKYYSILVSNIFVVLSRFVWIYC